LRAIGVIHLYEGWLLRVRVMRTIEVYTERNASLLLGLYMFLRSIDRVRCVLGLLRFIREGRAAPASH